jgi:hypothetical protein
VPPPRLRLKEKLVKYVCYERINYLEMKMLLQMLAVVSLGVTVPIQGADTAPKGAVVDFKKDIQPLFE